MKTNLKSYIEQLEKHQQTILDSASKIVSASITDLFNKIVSRTPVGNSSLWKYPAPADYNPGALKASWGITYNTNGVARGADGKFTSINNTGIKFTVGKSGSQNATIYNDQPYAQRVEDGWSTQAPSGMVKISIQEYPLLIEKNAKRYKPR